MYRPYKFLVVAVIQDVDDDGEVVNEFASQEPTVVFGLRGLKTYADNFDVSNLTPENPQQELNGGPPPGVAGMLGGLLGGATQG